MAGGVWEWCWDAFKPYAAWRRHEQESKLKDRSVAGEAVSRVLRGGAWNLASSVWIRGAARAQDREDIRDPDVGFRVVRSIKP